MKWGVRRFQKKDGTLTPAGKKRYSDDVYRTNSEILKNNPQAALLDYSKVRKPPTDEEIAERKRKARNIAIGVGVGITVAAAGIYYVKNKDLIDSQVANLLGKIKNKPISNIETKSVIQSKLLSPSAKNEYAELGFDIDTERDATMVNWFSSWASSDKHRYEAMSIYDYDRLDTNELSLKAGQIFNRVSSSSEHSMRGSSLYVSFTEEDNNRYKCFMPTLWKTNGVEKKDLYSISMKSTVDIVSPSKKQRVDAYIDLLKNDPKFAMHAHYDSSVSDAKEFALKNYNKFASSLCNINSSPDTNSGRAANIYLNKIRSMGYNALVDDNDAGRVARLPLILLNGNDINYVSSTKLSPSDIANAASLIKPMENETINYSMTNFKNTVDIMLNNLTDLMIEN